MKLMGDLVGQTLSDRYRLVTRLAGGGMGDVYRAQDLLLDRAVAVKVMQPTLAVDHALVARFKFEARAAARLTHPNVVGVYDWGAEDDRTYYMVMEYIPGSDLRDVLVSRGSLEPAHAVEAMTAVCDALEAAHSEGLIHRDIKPENVMIARGGRVKVTDFGIAAAIDSDRTAPGGAIPGTLRYLSPEQADGEESTPLSDIWAVGALLSECLTGRPPQQGSGVDLLRRRATEPPVPPSHLEPSLPYELDDIVMTACALDPADRFVDAGEMAAALRRAQARAVPDAPPLASLLTELTDETHLSDMQPTHFSERRKERRWGLRRFVAIIVSLLVIVGLVLGAATVAGSFIGPKMVDVPSLVDMDVDAARAEAAELDLEIQVELRKHREVPEGRILEQNPVPGQQLERGSVVYVVASDGPPLKRVPNVVGLDEAAAAEKLEERGLHIESTSKGFSLEPEGTIIDQDPSDERIPWGSGIAVTISKGPRPVDVPDVTGMNKDKAVRKLEKQGLVPTVAEVYSDSVESGRVVATEPGAGAETFEGEEVRVLVSIGPEFKDVKMPDVRGMGVNEAKKKLRGLNLVPEVVNSCPDGSTVVETDPLAGSTVKEGTKVALFVC